MPTSMEYWKKYGMSIKAKDMPRDAVLMGSVACTVDANVGKLVVLLTLLVKNVLLKVFIE